VSYTRPMRESVASQPDCRHTCRNGATRSPPARHRRERAVRHVGRLDGREPDALDVSLLEDRLDEEPRGRDGPAVLPHRAEKRPRLMPVRTTSRAPRDTDSGARVDDDLRLRLVERDRPRAFHTMQYVQRLSQPSCTLMPGRMRPVGVGVTKHDGIRARRDARRCRAARARTGRRPAALLPTARARFPPSCRSSEAKRLATQPVATTTGALRAQGRVTDGLAWSWLRPRP
jgi:hypothetical protein